MTTDTLLSEIGAGEGLSLAEMARLIPSFRPGRETTISCIMRWILNGVRGSDGQRIHLEAARIGGRWVSTRAALVRFVAAQTPTTDTPPTPTPTSGQRRRSHERARRRLAEIGM